MDCKRQADSVDDVPSKKIHFEDEHIEQKLKGDMKFMFPSKWVGITMAVNANTGTVSDKFIAVVHIGMNGDKFSRVTKRIWTNGTSEITYAAGEVNKERTKATSNIGSVKWVTRMIDDTQFYLISDPVTIPHGQLTSHCLFTKIDDDHLRFQRQILFSTRLMKVVNLEISNATKFSSECDYCPTEELAKDLIPEEEYVDLLKELREEKPKDGPIQKGGVQMRGLSDKVFKKESTEDNKVVIKEPTEESPGNRQIKEEN